MIDLFEVILVCGKFALPSLSDGGCPEMHLVQKGFLQKWACGCHRDVTEPLKSFNERNWEININYSLVYESTL